MRKINFCVLGKQKQRVDMYLATLFPDFSRSYLQKLIDKGNVKVNTHSISKNIKVSHTDEIEIFQMIESTNIQAEDIPLEVIYEDENILVINKESGINTHPTPGIEGKTGTLVNAILYHCREKLPTINGEERPGIVHRLDKDTSGAIMIAKNDSMMKLLARRIQERKVKKYYIAIVAGVFPEKEFKIESFIGRHPVDKIRMTTKDPLNPKLAITYGEVLGYIGNDYTILKIQLETGRTHQIRVHLASLGYPIIGDSVYGKEDINKKAKQEFGLTRQALHAYSLQLSLYEKRMIFIAPLKKDLQRIFDKTDISL